jgi:hypothetical protein
MHLIDLADQTSWPRTLVYVLEKNKLLFQEWFVSPTLQRAAEFDKANADVRSELNN